MVAENMIDNCNGTSWTSPDGQRQGWIFLRGPQFIELDCCIRDVLRHSANLCRLLAYIWSTCWPPSASCTGSRTALAGRWLQVLLLIGQECVKSWCRRGRGPRHAGGPLLHLVLCRRTVLDLWAAFLYTAGAGHVFGRDGWCSTTVVLLPLARRIYGQWLFGCTWEPEVLLKLVVQVGRPRSATAHGSALFGAAAAMPRVEVIDGLGFSVAFAVGGRRCFCVR
jgi:hypothetical protein